jgi:transposase
VFVGIDSHKDLLVGAVVDELGRVVSVESAPNDLTGHQALLVWLSSVDELERVGVECAGSYGRQFALALQAVGVAVVEVPPRLTARERRRDRRAGKRRARRRPDRPDRGSGA